MATLDKVKITMPGGKVFEATDNVRVIETQQAQWMFDGASTFRTLAEKVDFIPNDTAKIHIGSGTRIRTWTVEFTQWEGSTDTWGDSNDGDDVIQKLQEFGQTLATSGVDSTNPITFEYGEYTSGGTHSAQNVVPGEVTLPTEFGPDQSATTFTPSIQFIDDANITDNGHESP